jgi:hypothetical protein
MTSIDTLRAVMEPTRRRMIEYLHLHGPSQVGTLAEALDQQGTTASCRPQWRASAQLQAELRYPWHSACSGG